LVFEPGGFNHSKSAGAQVVNHRDMKAKQYHYVLITPARNEEEFIELTIRSLIAQTVRPLKWIIVSDGSTDRTDDIAKKYMAEHAWIELLRMPERKERHFGGKVLCFKAGCDRVKDLHYDIIGNLDADLSFESDLFAFLMEKFAANPKLGVGGAPFAEGQGTYDFRFSSVEHVSGACQLFRRECFEAIGGYTPIKGGGIDVVAVLTARMKGWETRTFPEKCLLHHRPMGTAGAGGLTARFKLGQKDYTLGRHLLWQTFRSFYQMTRRPFILGGSAVLAGYLWAMLIRVERPVSRELIQFQRREQMQRVKRFFGKAGRPVGAPPQTGKQFSVNTSGNGPTTDSR
jgi:biofilm PGA synthesis N-glycosyltransferase PgaC